MNLRPLTLLNFNLIFYPQNGDRIVTIDSVTSLHPVYRWQIQIVCWTNQRRVRIVGENPPTPRGSTVVPLLNNTEAGGAMA